MESERGSEEGKVREAERERERRREREREREREKGLGDKMIQKSVGLGGLQQVRTVLVLNKKESWWDVGNCWKRNDRIG